MHHFIHKILPISIRGRSACSQVLQCDLKGPTSVVKYGRYYWVTESQLGHLFGELPGLPSTPFLLRRFSARCG